jgi:hypothetical protein
MSNPTTPTQDILDLALAVKEAQAGLGIVEKYRARLVDDLANVEKAMERTKLDLVAADTQLAEAGVKVDTAKAAFEAYINTPAATPPQS